MERLKEDMTVMIDKKRLLDTFLSYVQIDSESLNERAMMERVSEDLRALGAEVWFDDSGSAVGSNGGNVYARLEGGLDMEPMLFSAHLDTVKPGNGVKPVVEDGVVRSSGDTILGGDDKSGVSGIMEALRTVTEKKVPHRTIEVLFTICEEIGLRGAKHADFGKLSAKRAVVLDSSGDAGKIITSAPGQNKFLATVIGRTAHAGIAPEQGISAIQVASEAIAAMKLLRIDEETTANFGSFVSEYATNIVPERAKLVGEVRSRDTEKLKAQTEHMKKCLEDACARHGATLECEIETAYLAYGFSEDDELVREVKDACARIGVSATTAASGGGSDANVMNLSGVKAVVLGTGMDKVHTTSERITVRNLEDTARLCFALMTGQGA